MKIAQVAPLHESVPPLLYGGTERVVSYLTEELVRQGHDVTLYASGDSVTSAELRPVCSKALRLHTGPMACPLAQHMLMVEKVAREAHQFDVVHFHIDFLPFSQIRSNRIPAVTTMHGRLDMPDLFPLFREFNDMSLVSISDAQREPMPWANWIGTVHHGLPANLYTATETPGKYLAFLGRVSPEKGLGRAIEIARRVGMPLRVAAKIDLADKEYFETEIKELLNDPLVEFIGEIDDDAKGEFLGNAAALLFPIDWPEPFGMVMIEAMACGTPVIAYDRGSVTEVLEDGITGFLVNDVEAAVEAVRRIPSLSRNRCREVFERRFSAQRMCQDYLQLYERVAEEKEQAA